MNKLISLILLLLIVPFLLPIVFIGLWVYGNPFYSQERTGLHYTKLKITKLKSIPSGSTSPDDWGQFIRKYSLDEILQLVNIMEGKMNFIGPRPLLPEYDRLYSYKHKKRYDVKPGLTGWAQVKGRNNLTWNAQFDLDVWYVENQSFLLDCKIIGLTILKILFPSKGETTLREKYNGRN